MLLVWTSHLDPKHSILLSFFIPARGDPRHFSVEDSSRSSIISIGSNLCLLQEDTLRESDLTADHAIHDKHAIFLLLIKAFPGQWITTTPQPPAHKPAVAKHCTMRDNTSSLLRFPKTKKMHVEGASLSTFTSNCSTPSMELQELLQQPHPVFMITGCSCRPELQPDPSSSLYSLHQLWLGLQLKFHQVSKICIVPKETWRRVWWHQWHILHRKSANQKHWPTEHCAVASSC